MPNWCMNELTVDGKQEDIEAFIQKSGLNGDGFSFQNLVPMPEILRQDRGDRQKSAMDETGFKDWYDWSVANWGTKWDIDNNYDVMYEEDTSIGISFQTAWASPLQFVKNVSTQFPTLTFTIKFDEAGCNFSGTYVYDNGSLTSQEDGESNLRFESEDE